MKHSIFVILNLLVTVSACTSHPAMIPIIETTSSATIVPEPNSLFDYDAAIPFDIKINSQTEKDDFTITDLNYAAHDPTFSPNTNGRTIAYLVAPKENGPYAGVVYLHWLGSANSNRKQFLDEAEELAKHGVVSLLLQGYYPWMEATTLDAKDRPRIIGQITELRRAVDFLLTQPNVDPNRLGYVGHDYGAVYGSTLSGIDQRLKTYVLIAGVPTMGDFQTVGTTLPDGYLELIEDLDPVQYVSKASPASLFFQFARNDQFISREMAKQLADAASEPKKIEWYDDSHQMNTKTVRQDREAWLIDQLGIK